MVLLSPLGQDTAPGVPVPLLCSLCCATAPGQELQFNFYLGSLKLSAQHFM